MSLNNQIIEDNRALYDSIGAMYPAHESVSHKEETINNIKCHWLTPNNPKNNELVIYIHGGGYAIGSIRSHKAMVSHFAAGLERTILFVDYSLAPEKPYPHGLNDVLNIYKWATQKHLNHNFYLMGDSAGGGMVISAMHKINGENLQQPKAIALISPWYNLQTNNPSSENRQHLDQILNKEMVLNFAFAYAGNDVPKADPSQLHFDNFPPTFVGVGTNEILFDDTMNLFDMIYKIQDQSQLNVYGGQGHVLTQLDIVSYAAQNLIGNMNNFFNQ